MKNYNHLIVKNHYFMNSFLDFKNEISYYISGRNVHIKMFQDYHKSLNESVFSLKDHKNDLLEFLVKYDNSILMDGYILDINKGTITITASNDRGVYYAINMINNLVIKNGNDYRLPIILIEDEPSFEVRGIIEGFYDTPWSRDEHLDLFPFMEEKRLNTYMYAPKDDLYHREQWYELYPQDYLDHFKLMLELSKKHHVDFWYTISPGYYREGQKPFNFSDETDFNRLFKKIDQLMSIGIRNFGLLLDDIDYKLSPENETKFLRPGIVHSYISNRFYDYVTSKIHATNVVMCPTEYHQIGGSMYRDDLKRELNDNIKVFYTGDAICAEALTSQDMKETREAFGKDLYIWDNFPVSDFTKRTREYLAPIVNRSRDLNKYASGYIINPSLHYYISKVGMSTMADFAWNSGYYHPEISFKKALIDVSPEFYEQSKAFIEFNYPSVLDHGNLEYERNLVDNNNCKEIYEYYSKVITSAINLLKLDLPIIEELGPWLKRIPKEFEIVKKALGNSLSKDELVKFLEDIHAPGSELLDYLVISKGIITKDEFYTLSLKHRGSSWYRVFENDRWKR